MKTIILSALVAVILFLMPNVNFGQAPNLRSTSSFALFTAAGAFNNLGASQVTGNIGTKVGAFSGFPPGVVSGQIHVADPVAVQAGTDVELAYAELAGTPCGLGISTALGNNQTLTPNVYCLGAASTLSGNLILDGQGNPNAIFIFKIDGALTASTFSSVTLINSASLCNVYWQINGLFQLGDFSVFRGTALVNGAISLLEGSSVLGRALTRAGAVSTHNNLVTVSLSPTASIIAANGPITFCAGGSVILSGNVGGTWSNGATTPTITVTAAGDYFVTNTTSCGSVVSNHIIVSVTPLPIASIISANGPIAICAGGSVILSGNVGGTWSNGATTPTITVTAAGDYFVTNTTSCGSVVSNHIIVSVTPLPIASIISANGPIAICAGGSVILSGNVGGTWSNGATTPTITVTAAGDYFVTNTTSCGSVVSNHIIVSVTPLPIASIISANGPIAICAGGSVILSGNVGGTWSNGATTPTITVTAGGDYFVTNTNACGDVVSNHIIVTINPLPLAPIIVANGPLAFCVGNNVILSGNTTGVWSTGATTPTITVTAAGDYFVTNSNACGNAVSNHLIVTVNLLPIASTGNNAAICVGSSVTLGSAPIVGHTYLWTPALGLSSATISNPIASPTQTTTYSLTETITATGCQQANPVTVTVNPVPLAPIIVANGPLAFCIGNNVILSGNTTGVWSTGATTPTITVTAAGDYFVTNSNACGNAVSNHIIIIVNPLPLAAVGNNAAICVGSSVTLGSAPIVGHSYLWTPALGLSSATISNPIASPLVTTIYSLTETITATGCQQTNPVTVTVNPIPIAPIIVANGPLAFCVGNNVILSGNTNGIWSTGATTPTITVSASGDYFVTNSNACGNAVSNHIIIIVNPLPLAAVGNNVAICVGSSVTLGSAPIVGHSYLWTPALGLSSATISNPIASPTQTTTYSLTETITATGCQQTNPVTVTVNPIPIAPIIIANGPLAFCVGNNVILSGNTTGVWSTGATTPTITVTASGDYFVTNSNACGNAVSNHLIVTVNLLPLAAVGNNAAICLGSSVTLGSAPIVGHSYLWTPALGLSSATISNPIASPTQTTTYSLTETITATGCQQTNPVTVTVNPIPIAPIIVANGPLAFCVGNNVILSGNTTGVWSTGATTPTITVSASGDYFVTNSNACGNAVSNHLIVTVNLLPLAAVGNNAAICVGSSVTLGSAPIVGHTYLWTPALGLSSATISNPIASPLVMTIYSLTETITATGCQQTNPVTVTVNPIPLAPIIVANGPLAFCVGNNVILSGNTNGVWSTGATTPTITVTASGDYFVTNSNACGNAVSNHLIVTVNLLPIASTGNNAAICVGSSVTLGSAPIVGHTYLWTPALGLSSATISNPIASPLVTTIYSLTETITATGCQQTNPVTVTVNPVPIAPIIVANGPLAFCVGNNVILSGNTNGVWSTGATTPTITVTASGDYFVTNSNACGNVVSNHLIVTVNQLPIASTGNNAAICVGSSVTLGSAPIVGHTYLWTPALGLSSATISNPIASPLVTTIYSLTETITATGCQQTNPVTVTVNPIPIAPIIIANGPLAFCVGNNVILSGNTNGVWSTGATTPTITVSASGDYFVTNSNACGNAVSNHLIVTVNLLPLAAVGNNAAICVGSSVTLGSAPIEGHSYLWTPALGLSSAIISNPVASPTLTTTYSLTETITATGCQQTNPVTVTVNPIPIAPIIVANGPLAFCIGNNVILSGNTTGVWSTGATTPTITVTAAGDYFVTNSNACGNAVSNHLIVTVNPLITPSIISANGPIAFCAGESVILSGNVGGTWSNGATTPTITVNTSGDYFVTNFSDCGNVISNHIVVTINPLPTPSLISPNGPISFCVGETTVLSGNNGGIWSNGATTTTITVNTSGDYFVTNTNECGSVNSNHIIVTVNQLPSITVTGNTYICQDQSTQLCATEGGASYLWSTGATTNCITVSAEGTYNVVITNESGCKSICIKTISISKAVQCSIGGNINICRGQSTELCAPEGLAAYLWSTGATTRCITVSTAGTYSLTVTNDLGCNSTCSRTVTYNPLPYESIISASGATSFCVGGSVILSGNNNGKWSNGATTPSITVNSSGDFFITNTNDCGSVTSNHIIVTVNPLPSALTGSNAIICNGNSVVLGGASTAGNTYAWTPATGLSSVSIANPVASPSVSTTYTLTETSVAGCQRTNSISINVHWPLTASVISASGPTTLCAADRLILSGNTGGSWSNTSEAASITVNTSGDYFVTNSNACGTVISNHIGVTVNPIPSAITGSNATVCIGTSLTLGVAPTVGNTYAWTPITGLSSASIANPVASPTVTTTYTLIETITATGCQKTNTVTVTVHSPLTASAIAASGPTTFCVGESVVIAGSTGGNWTNNLSTASITVNTGGDYFVTNTNACGTVISNHIAVTVNPLPTALTGSNTAICIGKSTTLGSASIVGNTYAWTPTTGLSSASISNPVASPTVTTTYSLKETITATGCQRINTVTVTVHSPLTASTISANGPTLFCVGQSVVLAGNSGGTWSNGATSASTSVNTSGNYFVTNTNACGTVISNHIAVTVTPIPSASTGSTAIICTGNSLTLGTTPTAGNTYAWSPVTGLSSASIANPIANPSISTTYTLTETSPGGCQRTNTIHVNVHWPLTASVISASGPTNLCAGQSVVLAGNSGGSWNNTSEAPSITVSTSGDFFVTNSNACGIVISNHIGVIVNSLANYTITGNSAVCQGQSTQLCTPAGASAYLWSTGATTNCITVSETGTYSVLVSNASGCSSTYVKTVTVSPMPNSTISNTNSNCQCQASQLCAPAGLATYLWSTGATTRCITVKRTGTYTVTVTNASGCVSTSSTFINNLPGTRIGVDNLGEGTIEVKAYPNPFSTKAVIEFQNTASDAYIVVELYNLLGNKIATLFDSDVEQGQLYRAEINSESLNEGIYIYKVLNGKQITSGKLSLIK